MDLRRAVLGIRGIDRDSVLVYVIPVHMMEMALMKIIHMAIMTDRRMPATRTMLVGVVFVVLLGTCGHSLCSVRLVEFPFTTK